MVCEKLGKKLSESSASIFLRDGPEGWPHPGEQRAPPHHFNVPNWRDARLGKWLAQFQCVCHWFAEPRYNVSNRGVRISQASVSHRLATKTSQIRKGINILVKHWTDVGLRCCAFVIFDFGRIPSGRDPRVLYIKSKSSKFPLVWLFQNDENHLFKCSRRVMHVVSWLFNSWGKNEWCILWH